VMSKEGSSYDIDHEMFTPDEQPRKSA